MENLEKFIEDLTYRGERGLKTETTIRVLRKFMVLTFLSSLITMTILTWLNVQLF